MDRRELDDLLAAVASGGISVEDAAAKLRVNAYSDLGFAKVDHHREMRQGVGEVVYGAGKTPAQIAAIAESMIGRGQSRVLITRIAPKAAREVERLLFEGGLALNGESDLLPFTYYDQPRLASIGDFPEPDGAGHVLVACGGTSDVYAAEEAALTAEFMGNEVVRLYDVGVAGLHRLLSHADELAAARVIVAVAGMEGALPSVIGGLVSCPVIAVPTSVGYGASLDGLAALLAMLNSCASGVSVVNIDNGFGAGYQASLINHLQ